MKKLLSLLLILGCLACCVGLAMAEPGDLLTAHTQQAQLQDPASSDAITAAVTTAVTAALPFLPPPYGAMVPVLLPLVGIVTNIWWRWRRDSDTARLKKERSDLLVSGIAYAEELSAAAKKTNQPMSPATTLQAAVNFIADRDPKLKLFTGLTDIEQRVTAYLARIPGAGATGANTI